MQFDMLQQGLALLGPTPTSQAQTRYLQESASGQVSTIRKTQEELASERLSEFVELERRALGAEKAFQKAVEEQEALRDELQVRQGAHATEIDMMVLAHGSSLALLRSELNEWWQRRLEQQRESDTYDIAARLCARFLEEELGRAEDLEGQSAIADVAEIQASVWKSKIQDLKRKLAIAEHHHDERLIAVQCRNVQRIRSLEAGISAERGHHADVRDSESRRVRQLERVHMHLLWQGSWGAKRIA